MALQWEKKWVAELAMSVLTNPKADREAITNAKDILFELIERKGRMVIPEWKTSQSKRTSAGLNSWQKFVKANSKKKMFRYSDGKINLKKMGIAYRKKKRR